MRNRTANLVLMLALSVLCTACDQLQIERRSGSPRGMAEMSATSGSDIDPVTRGTIATHQIRSVVDTTLTYTVRSIVQESDVVMIYVLRRGALIYWGEPYLLLRHSNPDFVRIGTTVVDSLTQY